MLHRVGCMRLGSRPGEPSVRQRVCGEVVIMSSEHEEPQLFIRAREEEVPVEELARRQGARPVESVDDMARPEVFDSDEEWQAFLDDLYASRHAGLA
jgi:hypothetical protein